MDFLLELFDLLLHVDQHLARWIPQFGGWFYALMFLIVFCETGLVVTPFLPGDSLLFALGAFAARDMLNLYLMAGLLVAAAILGDACNYGAGVWLGPRIFRGENVRFLNRKHLERTRRFFERYGGKTIVIARFVPIVRTFAPFVAGMGAMNWRRFTAFNVFGALAWITIFMLGGYAFGNLPFVRRRFTLVVGAIIVISVLPAAIEFLRERRRRSI
jgi:membrane-associated protein